jgi:hypothetical protein
MSKNLHVQLTREQLEDIARGKVVNLTPKDDAHCAGTQISEESAGSVAGGLFEDYDPAPDFTMEGGNNVPFGINGISLNLGLVSLSWSSCK